MSDIYRELSAAERYNVSRNDTGIYSNFAVTAKYTQPVDKVVLSHSLRKLVQAYSVFQLEIVRGEGDSKEDDIKADYKNYRAGPSKSIKFEDVVEVSEMPFDEKAMAYVNDQYIEFGPGSVSWRVVLFPNNYVTFYNGHAFFDGESGKHFHYELCKYLDSCSTETLVVQELYNYEKDGYKLHPSIFDLVDIYKVSTWETIKGFTLFLLPKQITRLVNYYTTSNYPDYGKSPFFEQKMVRTTKTNYKWIKISAETQTNLLTVLRKNQITITSFLDVLFRYSFQQVMLNKVKPPPSLTLDIVLSGRRFYPELAEQLKFQYLVTAFNVSLGPVESFEFNSVVEKLKIVKQKIAEAIDDKLVFNIVGLLGKIPLYGLVSKMGSDPRQKYLEISNLGFNKISAGKWGVEDLIFHQCLGASTVFGTGVVSTPNGLNIVLGYLDEYKGSPFEDLEQLMHSSIEQFIKDGA